MICPTCSSTNIHGPHTRSGAPRQTALMTCRRCGTSFDAYTLFGARGR